MSKMIFEETKELPSIGLFYGGEKRGRCVQLMKIENLHGKTEHEYITISLKHLKEFIRRLEKIPEVAEQLK